MLSCSFLLAILGEKLCVTKTGMLMGGQGCILAFQVEEPKWKDEESRVAGW